MKINFVYDFVSNAGSIVNGIDPLHIKYFFDFNFDLQNQNYVEIVNSKYNGKFWHWPNTFLYLYGNTDEICTSDINEIKKDELYLYPISTKGDLYEFISDRQIKHKTKFFYISNSFKKLLKENDNFLIYIEHSMEGYFDSYILKNIYDLCVKNDIPFDKVLITNGSNSNQITLDDFKEKYDYVKNLPKLVTYNWQVPYKSQDMRVAMQLVDEQVGVEKSDIFRSTIATIDHLNNPKIKKALLLTRRLRMHRIVLLSLLFNDKTIQDTLYSLDMSLNFYPDFKQMLLNERENIEINIEDDYIENVLNGYDLMVKQNKKVVDYELTPYLSGFGNESKELYENTFFSIVQETEFSIYQQCSTEKIMQPIMHCHPFVVIGSPYSLKNLKRLGFKTFDKWWDESYDNEIDDWKRLKKVYEVITILLNKTDIELKNMIFEMKEILIYNQEHLKTFDGQYINNSLSNVVNEFNSKKNVIRVL